jgi:prefoldin subunit 5
VEINLGNLVQLITIAVFVGAGINLIVIKPLGSAITALKDTILDLKNAIENTEKARQDMDKRLVRVEESTKSAHHRIDGIEGGLKH